MNEDGKEIRMNIPKPQRLSSSDLFNLVTEQLVKPPLSTVRFASPHMNLVNETLIHDAISLSKSQDGSILSYLAEYSGSPFLGDELSVHNFFNLSNDSWEKSAKFIKNDLNNTNSVDSHHNRDSSYSSCLMKMPVVANISDLANDSEIITNSWILPQIITCLPNEIIYQFLELPNIFLNSTIEHEKEDQDSYDSSLLFPSSWISLGNVLLAKPLVGKDKIYWEPRFLVLLDNCLFEFNQSNQIVGFAHLAGAKIAEIVLDSSIGPVSKYLTISFSETSNASMMGQFCISVQDCSRIQYLMQILVKASQLNVRDLFTIDSDKGKALLGKGRFNEVLKARRNGFSYQQFLKETLEQSTEGITLDSDLISKISGEPNIAIKAISKEVFWGKVKTGKERSDAIVREVLSQLLLSLKYSSKSFFPFVKIFGFFETQKGFLLELELMQELDLFDKLAAVGTISEENVQLIIARLVGAVCLMCHQGIAHRDIKLSNITFSIQEAEQLYDCKLADFGMAGFIGKDKKLRGRCGTPGYVSPLLL
jgi:energy-converting hydrogenase Eha subunit A